MVGKNGAMLAVVLGVVSVGGTLLNLTGWVGLVTGVVGAVLGIMNMKTAKGMAMAGGLLSVAGVLLALWAGNY